MVGLGVQPQAPNAMRIVHSRQIRALRMRCAAAGHNGEPHPLGRRALVGAGVALGMSMLLPASWAAAVDGEPDRAASAAPDAGSAQQEGLGSGLPGAEGGAADKSPVPLSPEEMERQATAKLLEEEEERRRMRRRKKGRIRELEEIRAELAEKELVLLEKEKELLEKEQTVMVLREELEIEKKLRTLLTKEKEKAEEEATLAMGLCTGGSMLP